MRDIEFVSYDGKWPSLCHGTLVLSIDGNIVSCGSCLSSGGNVTYDDEWNFTVTDGDWDVEFDNIEHLNLTDNEKRLIISIVNENVPQGCCGGCI